MIYEMCFSRVGSDDAVDGKGEAIVASPDDARDVQWASTTCVLGWSTLGVWPVESQPGNVNAVHVNKSQGLVAAACDDGQLKLFKWPASTRGAASRKMLGHSPHTSSVRFTADGKRILSTGAVDRALLVWNVDHDA